jgi:hypothetical protein
MKTLKEMSFCNNNINVNETNFEYNICINYGTKSPKIIIDLKIYKLDNTFYVIRRENFGKIDLDNESYE